MLSQTPLNTVKGPSSSIDGNIALFDGITGKLIKDGGPPSGALYTGASPSTVTVGGLASGTVLTGLTLQDILQLILVPYISPAFTSFSILGQVTTVEVGSSISAGSKTFTWTTSNSGNINANSLAIRDTTTSTLLASGLANSGSTAITIGAINFTTPTSHSWTIEATNTNSVLFTSSPFTVSSSYVEFYGDSASAPSNSTTVRALPSNRFASSGTSFSFNTGTTNKIFTIAMPATKTLTSVFDATAGFDITVSFVLSTFNVNDASATPVSYNVYILTNSVPYAVNHVFNIVTT